MANFVTDTYFRIRNATAESATDFYSAAPGEGVRDNKPPLTRDKILSHERDTKKVLLLIIPFICFIQT